VRVQSEGRKNSPSTWAAVPWKFSPIKVTVLADTPPARADLDEALPGGQAARRSCLRERTDKVDIAEAAELARAMAQLKAIERSCARNARISSAIGSCHAAFRRHTRCGPGQADEFRPAEGAAALGGQPLLQHVINTARANSIPPYLRGLRTRRRAGAGGLCARDVEWVLQADQLGTGHAVMQAMCVIPDDHTVLVLYGDVPLIRTPASKKLIAAANEGALAVIVRQSRRCHGLRAHRARCRRPSCAIVEHKDASPEQLRFARLNSGLMAAPGGRLREWLLGLGRNNSQREYYLTDVVAAPSSRRSRRGRAGSAPRSKSWASTTRFSSRRWSLLSASNCAEELMLAGARWRSRAHRYPRRGDRRPRRVHRRQRRAHRQGAFGRRRQASDPTA
jgi:molybdopterin-guanine dinucleotide biosynthesis protein A